MVAVVAIGVAIGLARRPATVSGHVVGVVARDIGHAATVTVRDFDGIEHVFDVSDTVDMSPAHLREHMTYGEPVTVTLGPSRGDTSRPIAERIVDGLR